jgi:hypothetical protein
MRAPASFCLLVIMAISLGAACTEPKLDSSQATCTAQNVSSPPRFVPPPVRAGKCNVSQLSDFRTACFEPATAGQTSCAAWTAANADCYRCAFSTSGDSTWGALVGVSLPGEVDFTNVGGCILVVSPQSRSCAEAVQAQLRCELAACEKCPVASSSTDDSRQGQVDALNACFDAASSQTCAPEANEATGCIAMLDATVQSTCVHSNDDLDDLFLVMDTMCGNGEDVVPPPSGVDAGVADTDAGAGDTDADVDASPGGGGDAGDAGVADEGGGDGLGDAQQAEGGEAGGP